MNQQQQSQPQCNSNTDNHVNSKYHYGVAAHPNYIRIQNDRDSQQQAQESHQINQDKAKSRKYDYLNKYNQHQLIAQGSDNQMLNNSVFAEQARKLKELRQIRTRHQRKRKYLIQNEQLDLDKQGKNLSLQLKRVYNTSSISVPKFNVNSSVTSDAFQQRHKSRSKSIQRSNHSNMSNQNSNLPHFAYLQAYKNNVTISEPYTFHNEQQSIKNYNFFSLYNSPHRQVNKSMDKLSSSKKQIEKVLRKIPNLSNGLSAQISYQNQIIRGQVNEYRAIVSRLQGDLCKAKQQLHISRQQIVNQKMCNEQIINQLKEQIIMLKQHIHEKQKNKSEQKMRNINIGQQMSISHQKQVSLQINYQNELIRGQVIELQRIISKLQRQNSVLMGYKQRYQILNRQLMESKIMELQADRFRAKLEQGQTQKENRQSLNSTVPIRLFTDNYTFSSKQKSKEKGRIRKNQNRSISKSKQKGSLNAKNTNNQSKYNSLMNRLEAVLIGDNIQQKVSTNHITKYGEQLVQKIQSRIVKLKKYEDFIYNIGEMYKKIQKSHRISQFTISQTHKTTNTTQANINLNSKNKVTQPSVRQLWKWLKFIGSLYSFMQSIKPFLGKKIGLTEHQSQNKQIKEILQSILMST